MLFKTTLKKNVPPILAVAIKLAASLRALRVNLYSLGYGFYPALPMKMLIHFFKAVLRHLPHS